MGQRCLVRALVRTRVFRWVQYAATGQWDAWSDDLTEIGNHGWNKQKLTDQFTPYFETYPGAMSTESDEGDRWQIEQILADPDAHDEWYLSLAIDLEASAEAGDIVAEYAGLQRR